MEKLVKHHTPYSQGCIRGVLRDMVDLYVGENVFYVYRGVGSCLKELPIIYIMAFCYIHPMNNTG